MVKTNKQPIKIKIEKNENLTKKEKQKKENKWISLAKNYQNTTGCSYRAALKEASEARKRLKTNLINNKNK